MSRSDGFVIADINVELFNDPKYRALWRVLRDPDKMARAAVVHLATILTSWGHGERLPANLCAPLWLETCEDEVAALAAVGLLDPDGMLDAETWEGWFGAARDRRQERRDSGRRGGIARSLATAQLSANGSTATAPLRESRTRPYRTDRTDPTNAGAGARDATPPRPLRDLMAEAGLDPSLLPKVDESGS